MTLQRDSVEFTTTDSPHSLVWLLGQPHLEEYLRFVRNRVVGGKSLPVRALSDEWREANDYYYQLEQDEAGEADRVSALPLPADLEGRVADLMASRAFQETFDIVETTIELVELDRLVIWQGVVDDIYATGAAARFGPDPDPDRLFDYCLPSDRTPPPFTIRRLSSDHYQVISEATDVAAQTPRLLDRAMLDTLITTGPLLAALAVPITVGANFMSAIRSDNRMVLHNGYHRAYALRSMGVRYAPCIVQTVTRRDELELVADSRVVNDPTFYFRSARPPLLRDFFDPKLAKRLFVHPIHSVIDVQISVSESSGTDVSF